MTPKRVYHYRIDFEGRVFHDGTELVDPVALRQLLGRVEHDDHGRPYARCMGEWMMLEPEDALFVIQEFEDPVGADLTRLAVRCQAGLRRRVDATRLRSRAHTFLYAEATDGLWARFGRRAAMRLAERHLEVAADGFDLVVGGERHPVLELDESGFARVLGSVAPPRARR